MSGRRVVVTGAAGFIGRAAAQRFALAGHEVTGIVRNPSATPAIPDVRWVPGDLAEPNGLDAARAALAAADVLLHCAGIRRAATVTPAVLERVNVASGPALAALVPPECRIVFVSSAGVHGSSDGPALDESTPFRPYDRYSRSKVDAERALADATAKGPASLTIVRPGVVYGPGDTYGVVANMIKSIARRRFVFVGPGANRMNPLHVDDLAAGLLLAATRPETDRAVIMAGAEPVSIAELAATIAAVLGVGAPRLRLPVAPTRAAAWLCEWLQATRVLPAKLPVSRASVALMARHFLYDASRAATRLGFRPRIPLADGIGEAVAWLRATGLLASRPQRGADWRRAS